MTPCTYHAHTNFSDGLNTAEEMIVAAIDLGCKEIGITDHAPMPFDTPWTMTMQNLCDYRKTLAQLRDKYADKIKVYIGLEQDYFSVEADGFYDYIIGSVHYVEKNGEILPIDESAASVSYIIRNYYGNDPYEYCRDYFELVGNLYEKTKCNIIGHFDLVNKFNEKFNLFSETDERYLSYANEAIDKLLKTPAYFELNSGVISRGHKLNPNPSEIFWDRIAKSGRKFVINTDTHSVDTITYMSDKFAKMLKSRGISYINSFEEILKG